MQAATDKMAALICVGLSALAVASTAHGELEAESDSMTTLIVKLKPKNGSGMSGTAQLTQAKDGDLEAIRVVLRLNRRVKGKLPAHIHTGPCKREPTWQNPRIAAGLSDVSNGRSSSLVYESLEKLTHGVFSINVHKSTYPNRAVACGDIPRAPLEGARGPDSHEGR